MLSRIAVIVLIANLIFYSCTTIDEHVILKLHQHQIPVLVNRENNPVLQLELIAISTGETTLKQVAINLEAVSGLADIESVRLFSTGSNNTYDTDRQFGSDLPPSAILRFHDQLLFDDTTYLWVSLQLKDKVNLQNRIMVSCRYLRTGQGVVKNDGTFQPGALRTGVALRQHMDDNVHTYRIPALATTNKGTLLTAYDVRRDLARDLQGDIDIGLNRSADGGISWEPMKIVLDMKEWGGLPRKFNGVSDANILVDRTNNTIFVAGLWMHGVLDEQGEWIEGLTEDSDAWEHQWRNKGSQPGFDVRETSQFMVTQSTDDGLTWSEPLNITRMGKKEAWWLWAPSPGQGITLEDGTLVMPTQGRNENGTGFSNISYSKDGGLTWTSTNPAYTNTSESTVVELSDGGLMLNMRHGGNRNNTGDGNGRAIAVTYDLGLTWSEHPTSRRAPLIEPTCMASLHKHEYTEDGKEKSVLLFSNPNSKTARECMTIKISFDNGQTWPEGHWVLLDELRSRGYSCLTTIDEHTIGILYEGSQSQMTFQQIPFGDLLNGKR